VRPDFFAVMRIYNPCSDPGNAANGFPCGDVYARNILATIGRAAGPPVAYQPPPGVLAGGACGPPLPLGDAEANLALPPGAAAVAAQVFAGRSFPVTQGWGPSRIAGEPAYLGYPHFHKSVDWGAPAGTPVAAPAAGVAVQRVGNLGNLIVDLRLPDGSTYSFFHLSRQIASGPTAAGAPIGLVGSTGYSTGPHLHLEKIDAAGVAVPPEHWACGAGAGPAGAPVGAGEYVFPVQGYRGTIAPHHGTGRTAADLFAPEGTPVLVMRGGTVTAAGDDDIGGFSVYIDADDGNDYYYAHLVGPPQVRAGQRVTAGQLLGGVGDTGNARGTGHHLHLGIGPRIVTGTGPAGGGGSDNYDATGLLQRVLACCVAR